MNYALNLKALLNPIGAAQTAGHDLRSDVAPDSKYYQIKDARNAARQGERHHHQTPDPQSQLTIRREWEVVYELGIHLIEHLSKDLEVVTWLIEALVRLAGLSGLSQGFELAQALIKHYGNALFPAEETWALKLLPLCALNGIESEGTLFMPLRALSLTDPQKTTRLNVWQYQQTLAIEQLTDPEVRQKRYAAGAIHPERFQKGAQQSGSKFYRKYLQQISATKTQCQRLSDCIDERCPGADFSLTALLNFLDDLAQYITYVSGEKSMVSPAPLSPSAANTPSNHKPLDFANRETALQHVLAVAQYFRQQEPQSLVPYLLERACHWGRLPLPQLIQELIADPQALTHFTHLTGIHTAEPTQE